MALLDPKKENLIKVIGLDLDGTLYISTPEIQKRIRTKIYEKISSKFEISFEQAKSLFEENYPQSMSGSKALAEIAKDLEKKDYPDIIQTSFEETYFLDLLEPNPKLNEMLIRLYHTRRLDLITSSEYNFALEKLEKLEINKDLFHYIFTGDNGSKSTGELYKIWLSKSSFLPSQHLYIGDHKKRDIDVPKSLGIKTCILGHYDEADFQIENILDLEKIL